MSDSHLARIVRRIDDAAIDLRIVERWQTKLHSWRGEILTTSVTVDSSDGLVRQMMAAASFGARLR